MNQLKTMLSVNFSDEICDTILEHFERVTVPAYFSVIGIHDTVRNFYFIESGLLRSYYIDNRGGEVTFDFYSEGEVVTILDSVINGKSSHFCVESVQPSVLLTISKNNLEQLIQDYPKLEAYRFRFIVNHNDKAIARTLIHQLPTAKERLQKFQSIYPNVLAQSKNKDVASFLRLTKESFSRLING